MKERIFKTLDKDDNEIELKFVKPNQSVMSKGDFVYREYFSKAIRAGLMTNAEAVRILKDREIWTINEEDKLVEIRAQIDDLQDKLEQTHDKEVGLEIYQKLKDLRTEFSEVSAMRGGVMDNTAESAAAEMRTQFFAATCVVYSKTGKKVFKDLDDFLNRLDERVAIDSYRQALIANYEQALGITVPENFKSELPEDMWLSNISEKENKEAEEPTKARKKRARRKKKTTK